MTSINKLIQKIKNEKIGVTGKKVLMLEGTDDVDSFSLFLENKIGPQWEQHWTLEFAEGKKRVLEVLQREPAWIGVVDRDEWSETTITDKQLELPNLCVLPRFCLENYVIDPDELWEALPQIQRIKIAGGAEELRTLLLQDKDIWLRHGVLWSVINPLWEGLRAIGFKNDLLEVTNAQDDNHIKGKLDEWHDYLDPDLLFETFSEQLQIASTDSVEKQLRIWIHGKFYYENVVHRVLNLLLGQKNQNSRKLAILQTRILPDDLAPLWTKMGL